MFRHLLFHIFMVYAVLSALIGISLLSSLVTGILVGLLVYFKNPKPNRDEADTILQPFKVSVIAHRGGATDAPENTIAAIREAKKNGADGIEFDLDFTSEGTPVLMHDDTVDRTTDGSGSIRNMSFDEVRKLNASCKHPLSSSFPDEKVPTLEEAVQVCLELGLKMYIDVKGSAQHTVKALVDLYHRYPAMYKNAIVCSFWPQVSYMVRRQDPLITCSLIHGTMDFTRSLAEQCPEGGGAHVSRLHWLCLYLADIGLYWSQEPWLWYFCGTSALLLNLEDCSKQTVEYFKERGIQVVVWTPNAKHDKEYVAKTLGCSYITDSLRE